MANIFIGLCGIGLFLFVFCLSVCAIAKKT